MPTLVHSITFPANAEEVFETCRDVERWPEFMPAVRRAAFIETFADGDIVTITAEANETIRTWQSKRRYDRERRIISFEQISPSAPLLSMRGQWTIEDVANAEVRVALTHQFEVVDASTKAEAFISAAIRSNATKDLEALRRHLANH